MIECNTLRRTKNTVAYKNRRLALASRARRGGNSEFESSVVILSFPGKFSVFDTIFQIYFIKHLFKFIFGE